MELTGAILDTGGPKVVLPVGVGHQFLEVGLVGQEARTRVLAGPVVLEVQASLGGGGGGL